MDARELITLVTMQAKLKVSEENPLHVVLTAVGDMARRMVVMSKQEMVMALVEIGNFTVALGTVTGTPMGDQQVMQPLLVPVGRRPDL